MKKQVRIRWFKWAMVVVASLVIATGVFACGPKPTPVVVTPTPKAEVTPTPKAEVAPTKVLRLAHQFPKDHFVGDAGDKLSKMVYERTKGEIKIVVYPAEMLLKGREIPTALKAGTIDMAIVPWGYCEGMVPALRICDMSFLVGTLETAFEAFRAPEIWEVVTKESMEKLKAKPLGLLLVSTAIGSNKRQIITPSDLKGLTMRIPSKSLALLLSAEKGSVVSMASTEIYMALQTGVMDGYATSKESIDKMRLYEVTKYINTASAPGVVPDGLWIQVDAWNGLTKEQQRIIEECSLIVDRETLELAKKADEESVKRWKAAGAQVHVPTREELEAWRKAAEPHWAESLAPAGPLELKLLESVKKYAGK